MVALYLTMEKLNLIVNALALSRVWYIASLIPMPDFRPSSILVSFLSFGVANVTWLPEM